MIRCNFTKSLLFAIIATTFCFCGSRVTLYTKDGIDKFDLYDFNSVRALLNKQIQKVKIDPALNVLFHDSTLASNDINLRKIVFFSEKSEKILSLEIRNDSIQRITIFSDKIVSKSKPSVGKVFSEVNMQVLPYLPRTINGSVGLLDSYDNCVVYHFEFLKEATLINENNLEQVLQKAPS